MRLAVASVLLLAAALLPPTLRAEADVRLSGVWKQGELITGTVPAGTAVEFRGRKLRVSPQGLFIVGLDRDEPETAELRLTLPGGKTETRRFTVQKRAYSIQRIDGLPADKVNPPAAVQERIRRDQALATAARMRDSDITAFAAGFAWPNIGRISGVYGSQRILNGEAKQPHYGVDVAVTTGTPVKAPAGGIVSLAEPDMYYTGGTLMIDHGHGLTSAFLHLSALKVQLGDVVSQGQVIALVGATGRATGPHLDWRISWFDARIDPQRLVPPMPGAKAKQKEQGKTR